MDTSLVLVLLFSPFLGFLFNVFLGKKAGKTVVGIVGTLSVVVSFAMTLYLFGYSQVQPEPVVINLFDWISIQRFTISFGLVLTLHFINGTPFISLQVYLLILLKRILAMQRLMITLIVTMIR